jgi:1-acylglycerone phosphate reductase
MTQTFFPLLRIAKGAVVNIGSVSSWMIVPYNGLYSSSKEAVGRINHEMRIEFEPFGVDVVLVSYCLDCVFLCVCN